MAGLHPRFSLLTILLLMALVACGITIWQLWREVGPLRAEVRRLRDEAGVLSVDDPTKVHAIRVDTKDELLWKWRVWIPQNRTFVIRCRGRDVPSDGFPMEGTSSISLLGKGEQVIVYRVDQDRRDDKWYGTLEAGSARVGRFDHPWVKWSSSTSMTAGVGKATSSFKPGQRIELIRHRISQASDSRKIEDPSAGFMIWLEPDK
jgi:hypothetical protein